MSIIKIFTEGDADVTFLRDYLSYIHFEISEIEKTNGWTNIDSQKEKGESTRISMNKNTDNGGINLIIFDADKDFKKRKRKIEAWKNEYDLKFELFLFPDNRNAGALEDLLEKIIQKRNQPIFECWEGFEYCLKNSASKTMRRTLTVPAKKTKIYAYLEVLLGESRKEKDMIKDQHRNYKNDEHWDLDCAFLEPLKNFLSENIK
jgi:hypothetical protein